MVKRSRLFCFTNFNLDFDYDKYINENKTPIAYIICGREECPKTGKLHDQGFIYFNSQRNAKLNTSGKWFSRALGKELGGNVHNEMCKGSLDDNCKYCSKDNNVREWGIRPKQGFRTDLEAVKDSIMNHEITVDDICVEQPNVYHQYGRTLEKLEDIALRKKYRTWMTEGVWLYGKTGTGKSHEAFKDFDPDTHYVLPNDNGWWDGYKGQEIVIINEFRGGILFSELLDLVDKFPKSVKRRGREPVPFLAKKVIITSSLHPEEVYSNISYNDKFEQFERRFIIKKLTQKWSEGNTKTSDPE